MLVVMVERQASLLSDKMLSCLNRKKITRVVKTYCCMYGEMNWLVVPYVRICIDRSEYCHG